MATDKCRDKRGGIQSSRLLTVVAVAAFVLALLPAGASATTAYPYFESTGSLIDSRTNAAAVALASGEVLVAGGCHYSSPKQHTGCTVKTAELYDPEAESFSATGSMTIGRAYAAAAPLPGGKALIAGGANTEGPVYSSAEVYDSEAGTFSATGSMAVARWGAAAAPLPDGRVLVAGGAGLTSAEIYDPEAGTFSATGSLSVEHRMGFAAPLPDGSILVAGGFGSGGVAEIFDPESETFSTTGSMSGETALIAGGAALADGSVLAFGDAGYTGFEVPRVRDLQLYDPVGGAFSTLSLASPPRSGMAVGKLPGGRVLVAGGAGDEPKAYLGHAILPTAEIFVSAPSPQSPGLDFGAVPVSETSGPGAMTIVNLGAQDLEVEAAALTGADAADFEIVEDECTGETLGFEESCDLLISVTPSAEEPLSASVQLTDNAPSSAQAFALAADASETPAPASSGGEDSGAAPDRADAVAPDPPPAAAAASSSPAASAAAVEGGATRPAKRTCPRPRGKARHHAAPCRQASPKRHRVPSRRHAA